ncbi:hypothetical protein O6H91_02G051400 [Diphasiastrum complanatum]|uniref:Uncharacterized protein n=1 Tax=Diphasiastrum complanatum TaxID=34168 RepID=A0ACC2EFN5_DIPCM|nr:hypothetical protein O6H91_02G051400 [Diphasiastrum complanatum]
MAALTLPTSLYGKSQQSTQVNSRSLMQHVKLVPLTKTSLGSYRNLPRLSLSCMSKDNPESRRTSTTPAALKKMSTNFSDIFAFSGPAPEKINGRLAMLGFVSALGVEIATGQGLLGQLDNGGLSWFVVTAVLFTSASLIPLFQGISAESKSQDFCSFKAETWNGQAAMVGLVALALTEYVHFFN